MSPSYCPSKQQSQSAMLSVTSWDIWSLSVFGGIIRPGQASHCVCFDLLLQRNLGMFDNCGTDRIDGEHSGTFWSVADIAQSSPHILLDIINSSARSLSKSKDNKHNEGSSEFWWTATGPKFSEPQLVWTRLNIPAAKFLQIEQFAKLTKKSSRPMQCLYWLWDIGTTHDSARPTWKKLQKDLQIFLIILFCKWLMIFLILII